MNLNPSNILEFNKIMDESINCYQSIKEKERLESLLEITRHINGIEGLHLKIKKRFCRISEILPSQMVVLIQMKNIYMTELQKN